MHVPLRRESAPSAHWSPPKHATARHQVAYLSSLGVRVTAMVKGGGEGVGESEGEGVGKGDGKYEGEG